MDYSKFMAYATRGNEFGSRAPCDIGIYLDSYIEGTIGKLSLAVMARYAYKRRFSSLFRQGRPT